MGCPALEGFDKMAESLATMATIDDRPLPSPVALQPSTGPPYVNDKMRIPSTLPPHVAHQPHIANAARHHKSLRLFPSLCLTHTSVHPSLSLSLQTCSYDVISVPLSHSGTTANRAVRQTESGTERHPIV